MKTAEEVPSGYAAAVYLISFFVGLFIIAAFLHHYEINGVITTNILVCGMVLGAAACAAFRYIALVLIRRMVQ